jgi:hypothetical protein
MSSRNNPSLQDRLNLASEAKNAMLAKFKRAIENPDFIEKRRQREAIVAARAERAMQRKASRDEHERELARQAALAVEAAEAAAEGERAVAERAACEAAERQAVLEAEQKAARDARYTARKAAKKERRRGY